MLYHLYELQHAALAPWRMFADLHRWLLPAALNPWSTHSPLRPLSAGWDVFERFTRRYEKPAYGLQTTTVDGQRVAVEERVVHAAPFCNLLHFRRDLDSLPATRAPDPRVLLVAPMSGHHATLLRGTVQALLPDHEVYLTDWRDARTVPLAEGHFDLEDYIDYLMDFLRLLGPGTHLMAVCQPGPAALAATALLAAEDDAAQPQTLVLMACPIDTRLNPTQPNVLATTRSRDWFEHSVLMSVPFPNPGALRRVYPGFLQLSGFMTMNLERHLDAHGRLYQGLLKGDDDSVAQHHRFYDEYLSVMDLTAEFYMQTLQVIFQEHHLPRGVMTHRGRPVDPAAIRRVPLMTVEGEKDDICGIGQTRAAHDLCVNVPESARDHFLQPDVGHYGVFSGSQFSTRIAPRVSEFFRRHESPH